MAGSMGPKLRQNFKQATRHQGSDGAPPSRVAWAKRGGFSMGMVPFQLPIFSSKSRPLRAWWPCFKMLASWLFMLQLAMHRRQ